MNEKHTGKVSANRLATDWERLRSKSDEQIRHGIERDSGTHATDPNFWKNAKVVLPLPKQTVTIRLDADLLQWLRKEKGYQTRINAVLRAYMEAQDG